MVGIAQPTKMQLIPLDEMTPGQAGAIRNQIIESVVAQASRELALPYDKLIVRDIRPLSDLALYEVGTTALAGDDWIYVATTLTANVYTNICANPATMADNRFVAIYGVRDRHTGIKAATTQCEGTAGLAGDMNVYNTVSLIKINVGGSDKVIWDIASLATQKNTVGICPTAVIIPQNATYNIAYKFAYILANIITRLQLIGVVVEPRGLVLSP